MKHVFTAFLLLIGFIATAFPSRKDRPVEVISPEGAVVVRFQVKEGVPYYSVQYRGKVVVKDSRLGFLLKDQPALNGNFKIVSASKNSFDETWTQPWGEAKNIRNRYNSTVITLEEQSALKRKMAIVFRVYDDGLGFRYEIPAQPNLANFVIMDELTEFALAHDFSTWWIPAYGTEMDSEYLYRNTNLSQLNEKVHTPLTLETDGLLLSIHEAALVDYAGMALESKALTLKCDLVPWSNGNRVEASAPMKTPWRTLQLADKPGDLVTSYLILNLNERISSAMYRG